MMKAASFPVLVYSLAVKHHDGALLPMSIHCRIPQSTLWRWVRGLPTRYTPDLIRRLCRVYDLPVVEVYDRIRRDEDLILAGKPIVLPDLSDVRPGPVATKRGGGGRSSSGGAAARRAWPPAPPTPVGTADNKAHYVNCLSAA